ncbi:ABC transporter substrate-binding protein [Paracoccus sp. Z118]|uniref:ABC transporter substrate-binding protein n=1 Tax=Paracoccus sp. Z118 TaxID=2851017 RepID=UPI001C2BE160|nr:ABC transporter substrate-binding protein [Paracoccus sp. Z118]MBV0892377.1 ABC transporter substrate-binding protein [Paracoccus sp. Z118]
MKPLRTAAIAATLFSVPGLGLAAPSGQITVYTSQPQEQMATVVAAFNEDHPDVQVEVFRTGTTELMSKLQAEFAAGSTPADVLLIADAVAMTQLKQDDRLLAYADAPTESIPDSVIDPDRTFFGTKLITTGIVYNTNLVETAPASWDDLTAEDVAGSLIMPSPLYSGAAVIHVGTMVQQPAFGWDWYEALADAGAVAGQGNGTVIEAVARGEKAYGIIIEYMAMNAARDGSPVGFVWPEQGVSSITQPVAILKGTDNEEAAKAFVDWQLSRTAQEQSVEQGYFPVIEGVAAPEGYPALDALTILPLDAAQLMADDQANKEQFADLFGG